MTDASKWLAGSVPFAAAVFGFLGVTDGEVTRILMNFTVQFVGALVFILLAAALGALVPVLGTTKTTERVALLGGGLVMLIVGLIWMAQLAAKSGSANERPRISTKLAEDEKDRNFLSAEISGAGLKIDEHLIVTVTGRPRDSPEGIVLYGARVGPDVTGSAAHSLAIPVRMRQYEAVDVRAQLVLRPEKTLEMLAEPTEEEGDCNEESGDLACVTVFTPPN